MKTIFKHKIAILLSMVFISILLLPSCKKSSNDILPPISDSTALVSTFFSCDSLLAIADTLSYPKASIESFTQTVADGRTAEHAATTQYAINNINYNLQVAKTTFETSAYGAIPAINLVAAWKFEEGQGSSLVSTGSNPWTAQLQGGPTQVFGPNPELPTFTTRGKEKAIKLENGACLAIDDYTTAPLLGNQFTISIWVNPDATQANNYIFSFNYWNNWKLNIQSNAMPQFTLATASGITDTDNGTPQSVPPGKWTHVVVTVDLSDPNHVESFYINGVLTRTWTAAQHPSLSGSQAALYMPVSGPRLPIMIGTITTYDEVVASFTWAPAPTQPADWSYFSGSLDNIEIYNIALSAGQVSKVYNDEKE